MSTRREFILVCPCRKCSFRGSRKSSFRSDTARAQPALLKGYFDPTGKGPSKFTLNVLKQAKASPPLPYDAVSTPPLICINRSFADCAAFVAAPLKR